MLDPFVDNFLKNYKQKQPDFNPYLKLDELHNFQYMKNPEGKKFLEPGCTYIKYIKAGDEYQNNKCDASVIQDGGMLLAGGYFLNGEFVETNDKDKWYYLKLDTIISKKTKMEQKRYYSYYIKLVNYHIFYKHTRNKSLFDVILKNA
ncbi:mg211 protein [Tupanvirus deep ocean]|uniref:Mg211 protein n=2 Tax=Tupanvirus TaxID=2094720 RepID=A0AC62A9I4_9VIRU|nr:mg211 protein [Tupanvirus deep ocean]QKU34338.1 mg211 protein [Tupanvirus deep ocean]